MRKNLHGKILRGKPKEQHQSTMPSLALNFLRKNPLPFKSFYFNSKKKKSMALKNSYKLQKNQINFISVL